MSYLTDLRNVKPNTDTQKIPSLHNDKRDTHSITLNKYQQLTYFSSPHAISVNILSVKLYLYLVDNEKLFQISIRIDSCMKKKKVPTKRNMPISSRK